MRKNIEVMNINVNLWNIHQEVIFGILLLSIEVLIEESMCPNLARSSPAFFSMASACSPINGK